MATTPRGITLMDGQSIVNPIETPFNRQANEIDLAITEAVAEAVAQAALALPKWARGSFTLTAGLAPGQFVDRTVNFPAGTFSTAPFPFFSSTAVRAQIAIEGPITASSMKVRIFNGSGDTGGVVSGTVISWMAVQA